MSSLQTDEQIRERLRKLRQHVFKGNNASMARASDLHSSTLHRVLSGATQNVSTLVVESVLDNIEVNGQRVSRAWLENGDGSMLVSAAAADYSESGANDWRGRQDGTSDTVVAGLEEGVTPTLVAHYEIDYVPLPALREGRREKPFLTRVIGSSMEPMFSPGDRVVITPQPSDAPRQLIADAVYVVRFEDVFRIKQIERLPGRRLLCKAANDSYGAFEIDLDGDDADFEIVGRVWGKFTRY